MGVPAGHAAAHRRVERIHQVHLDAEPLQPDLPGGGEGDEPILRRDWRWVDPGKLKKEKKESRLLPMKPI